VTQRAYSANDSLKSIGEVITALRDEFPDISISKIRFLEANGLLNPARTSSGYRKFSVVDIEHLRYILRMQRDYFLPLRVIREHIDAMNRGLEPPVVGDVAPKPPKVIVDVDEITSSSTAIRLTKDELIANCDNEIKFVNELIDYGIIRADASGFFSGTALNIAQKCASLAQFGLGPRHLKTIVTSASREVELFEPILKNSRSGKNPLSKAQAEDLALQLAGTIVSLHAYVVRDLLDLEN
jgi:DNA-binding transcriptional MerR regulator